MRVNACIISVLPCIWFCKGKFSFVVKDFFVEDSAMAVRWNGTICKEDLGGYIRSLRRRAGLSQGELAGKAGVSPSSIVRLEDSGKVLGETLDRVCDALCLSDDEREEAFRLYRDARKVSGAGTCPAGDGVLHAENAGAHMRSLRLRAGMLQADVSLGSGVSRTTVSLFENGKRVSPDTVRRIAAALGASDDEVRALLRLNAGD